ncbi:MAG: Gfo/Idh/MocA family oxidoreductase [Candidatus Krumholzibacteria bacterium]|nr:Gfo/Idh/MocA family oxidoreductase [Candidatus Krumholzibacteria bacterium]
MIRMGVIGCGYWGPNLIRNFMHNAEVELVSMADLDPQRLQRVGNLYPFVQRSTDPFAVIGDPSLDAVVVATPVASHYPLGKAVLEAGKHLFVEKPMASSSDECKRLLEAADARGLVIMVGHTFLFSPAVRKIRSLIDAGDLGDIYYVSITRVNLGIFQKDVNVVWDLAPHDVAMLNHLFGANPDIVSATGRSYVQIERSIEDVAFLTLEYPGRQIAHVHVSWLDPNKIRRATFVGSRKMLVYDDVDPTEKIKVYDKGVEIQPHYDSFGEFQLTLRSGDIFVPRVEMTEPLKIEAQHFVDVIKGDAKAISSGQHGLDVVVALEKACQSIKEDGRPLEVGLSV